MAAIRHLLHSKAEWMHRPARKPPEAEIQQFWRIPTKGGRRIFRARIPHKALEIWYCTLHGKLSTRDRLVKLNIAGVESQLCPICKSNNEDPGRAPLMARRCQYGGESYTRNCQRESEVHIVKGTTTTQPAFCVSKNQKMTSISSCRVPKNGPSGYTFSPKATNKKS